MNIIIKMNIIIQTCIFKNITVINQEVLIISIYSFFVAFYSKMIKYANEYCRGRKKKEKTQFKSIKFYFF